MSGVTGGDYAICPACGTTPYLYGPKFLPRRPWRPRPSWKCTWCGFRWFGGDA